MKLIRVIKSIRFNSAGSKRRCTGPTGIYEVKEVDGMIRPAPVFYYLIYEDISYGPFSAEDWKWFFDEGYLKEVRKVSGNVIYLH